MNLDVHVWDLDVYVWDLDVYLQILMYPYECES